MLVLTARVLPFETPSQALRAGWFCHMGLFICKKPGASHGAKVVPKVVLHGFCLYLFIYIYIFFFFQCFSWLNVKNFSLKLLRPGSQARDVAGRGAKRPRVVGPALKGHKTCLIMDSGLKIEGECPPQSTGDDIPQSTF